jgi:hypothetical protein
MSASLWSRFDNRWFANSETVMCECSPTCANAAGLKPVTAMAVKAASGRARATRRRFMMFLMSERQGSVFCDFIIACGQLFNPHR